MQKISTEQKKQTTGGFCFFSASIAIGVLVTAVCEIAGVIVNSIYQKKSIDNGINYKAQANSKNLVGSMGNGMLLRLSPHAGKTAVGLWI